jgi:hypothetical protein
MEQITASCVIRDRQLYRNGRLIWEKPHTGQADFLLAAYAQFGFQYPKFYKMDQLSKLGWLACELLLSEGAAAPVSAASDAGGADKGFDAGRYQPEDVAVVLSNSNASLDTDYKYFATVKDIPSPALFVYTLPNIVIGEICIRHKFKGENAFFIFEAFDAEFIAGYVRDLIRNGNARVCICGWVELLAESYSAALFLVEDRPAGLSFSAAGMTRIIDTKNA